MPKKSEGKRGRDARTGEFIPVEEAKRDGKALRLLRR